MKVIDNFFKNKYISFLFYVFIILSVIEIIYASLVSRGVIFDGSYWFINLLDHLERGDFLYLNSGFDVRPRFTVLIVDELPLKIAYFLNVKSKYWLSVLYSLPLFLNPFLITISNCFLAKYKTQRYDIAVLSLALFSLFLLPVSMYPAVEMVLAISVILLLYHYLCADIDYKISDILIILFLIIFTFGSTEANLYMGFILFFISLYYAKNTENKKNKIIKYVMGLCFLFMPLYELFYFKFNHCRFRVSFMDRFTGELNAVLANINDYSVLAIWFFLIMFAFILFKKNKFGRLFNTFLIIILFSALFYVIYFKLYISTYFFPFRFLLLLAIPAVILSGFILDILRKNTEKYNNIFHNMLIVVLIIGIFHTCIQIINSFEFNKSKNEMVNIINNSDKTFIYPDVDMGSFFKTGFNSVCSNFDTFTYDYIAFNRQKLFIKIILYNILSENEPHIFYFNKFGDMCIPMACLRIKNAFWDFTDLRNQYYEQNDQQYYEQNDQQNQVEDEIYLIPNRDKEQNYNTKCLY